MKKKTEVKSDNSDCMAAPPPWHNKTREQSFHLGRVYGYDAGFRAAKEEMKAQLSTAAHMERESNIKLINAAGQSIDAVARALSAAFKY
jgi:hypothetical protein